MRRTAFERQRAAAERSQERTIERRELRMTDAYHIGTLWEQTAKEYYGHDRVDIEFNVATGLYKTDIDGRVSGWMHESYIKSATAHRQAQMQEQALIANIPSEDI